MERRKSEPASNGDSLNLASRLLASHFPYAVAGEQPRIFVRQLPEDPPFEVPIPEGFALVGSMVLEALRGRPMAEVVLDTELPADEVRRFYRELLTAGGWSEVHRATEPGGFVRGPRGFLMSFSRALHRSWRQRRSALGVRAFSTLFRLGDSEQTLIVTAEERAGVPTDVRLRLISGRNPAKTRWRNDPEAMFIMPLLTPPPRTRGLGDRENTGLLAPPFDARHSGGSYGGRGWEHDGAYSFTALETDLDLTSITAHYVAQLEGAGWSRSGEGMDGPQAWNTWTFSDNEDHPWSAVNTALQVPALSPPSARRPNARSLEGTKNGST